MRDGFNVGAGCAKEKKIGSAKRTPYLIKRYRARHTRPYTLDRREFAIAILSLCKTNWSARSYTRSGNVLHPHRAFDVVRT